MICAMDETGQEPARRDAATSTAPLDHTGVPFQCSLRRFPADAYLCARPGVWRAGPNFFTLLVWSFVSDEFFWIALFVTYLTYRF
jgi:hypothetical protein